MNNVITGVPRSGTSLMSKLIHDAVGSAKFHGTQWRQNSPPQARLINAHGFYESAETCRPIRAQVGREGDWLKVITPALVGSRSILVGKVIACIRHPQEVAESRRIMRTLIPSDGRNGSGLLTPEIYIAAMGRLSKWVQSNRREMPLIVDYSAMLLHPTETCAKVSEYIGSQVNPAAVDHQQQRSARVSDGQNWEYAIEAYEAMIHEDLPTCIRLYETHACIVCKRKKLSNAHREVIVNSNPKESGESP